MATTKQKDRKDRRKGRHTRARPLSDDSPGAILLLALIGALPVVVLFIFGQIYLSPEAVHPLEVWPAWRNFFYFVTPAASALALWFYRRAPAYVKDHNASRVGRNVAFASLLSWALFGGLYLWLF